MKGKIQRSEDIKEEVSVEKWLMRTCIVCPDVHGIKMVDDDIQIDDPVICNFKNKHKVLKDFPVIPFWCPRSNNFKINKVWAASERCIDAATPILLNQFITLEDLHNENGEDESRWGVQARGIFFNYNKDPRKTLDNILSCSPNTKRILKIIFNQNKQEEIIDKKGNITKNSLFKKMKELKIPCYKRQKIFDEIMEIAFSF